MASEVGYPEAALEYFVRACAVDLADAHGNTADGIHIASCGGTWLALVAGFGGLRDFDGRVRLRPRDHGRALRRGSAAHPGHAGASPGRAAGWRAAARRVTPPRAGGGARPPP